MKGAIIAIWTIIVLVVGCALGDLLARNHARAVIALEIERGVKDGKVFWLQGSNIKLIPRRDGAANISVAKRRGK